jgi:hypothetical protein
MNFFSKNFNPALVRQKDKTAEFQLSDYFPGLANLIETKS